MRISDLKTLARRCALIAAFFVCGIFAEEPLGVFSAAPDEKPAPKTPPPAAKEDDANAVVVDLNKSAQIADSAPPNTKREAIPAGETPVTNAYAVPPPVGIDPVPAPTDEPAPIVRTIRNFKDLANLPDGQFDIAEAILALGEEHDFELSEPAAKTLKRLDDIAARAREQIPANADASDYFDALYDVVLNRRPIEPLHDERAEDYDLSRAVFQHRGSCLSMGIFALSVANRLNAPVSGAQCPNHFFLRGSGIVKGKSREVALNFDVSRPTPDNWSKLDDNFYRKWRHFDVKAEDAGEYLRPLTARQVVSAFLASRAGFLGRERKFTEALSDAERALSLNPRNIIALINAGFAQESLHKLEEAEASYKQAIDIDPQCVRALNNLAFVKSRDKKSSIFDTRKAEKLIDQAIKIDPDQAYLYATRGEVFAARGEYKDATRSMQTAVNLSPKNSAYRERFMILREHLRSEGRDK